MDFSYTSEQKMLRDSAADFASKSYGFQSHLDRLLTDFHFDGSTWRQFAELGWLALPLAEDVGGLDGGGTELSLICEELGAGMVLEPYISGHVFPARLLESAASTEQRGALLGPLADGSRRYAVAWAEVSRNAEISPFGTRAVQTDKGYLLTGRKLSVLNATNSNHLIVCAQLEGSGDNGASLFIVDEGSQGLAMEPFTLMGGGVAADISLDNVAVDQHALVGMSGGGLYGLSEALDFAVLCSSAYALGLMRRLLEATWAYLKVRKQFGVPIGSFQVLQHRAVEMYIEYEQSRSMVMRASLALHDTDSTQREIIISACKVYLDRAASFIAKQAVQLHGGIGVTEELDVGHLFRQLTAYRYLYTDTEFHLNRLEKLIL